MMTKSVDGLRTPLSALMRWFESAGLRAAIIGGVAASLRGKPRLTKDIDAVVLDADAEVLIAGAARFGFVPRIPDAAAFAHRTRMLLLHYQEGNVDIDISLGALPFEEEVIDRSTLVDIGDGVRVRLASSEDLVIMKAVAGRGRDVTDIENIVLANANLDVDRIRRWVREFASVLDMPEIHDDLEKLLKRRKR
jgi:predicted nucleotidyltransferase